MQRFFTAKLAFVAAAGLMLTGCISAQKAEPSQEQQTASQEPIDTICVVRHPSSMLRGDDLLKAIASGLQRSGVKTRVVDHNQVPEQCRFCLFYGVTTKDEKVESFDFQAVVDGRALQRGSGPIGEDGSIKLQTVADYAAGYLQSLVNAGKQKQARPGADE